MQKAAIYARVSRDEQAKSDKYSLPTQIAEIRDYCTKQGYEVVETFKEDESGLIFERPELQKLLKLGEQGYFDVVVSLCPDRLARGISSYTLTSGALEEIGVGYEFVQGGVLDDSPESQLTLEISAVISGYESKKIRERSMRGRKGRATSGKYVKGAVIPYGYIYKPKSADCEGELIINEEEAEIVRLIFYWYVYDRIGSVAIAGKLSKMGIKRRGNFNGRSNQRTESAWNGATVIWMIRNETYAGIYHYGTRKTIGHKVVNGKRKAITERSTDSTIPVKVPAIIPHELWQAAQERRVKNQPNSSRNTKRFYLMQGQLRCSTCGTQFRAYTARDKQKNGVVREYRYYQCSGQLRDRSPDGITAKCRGNISADIADLMAWSALLDFLGNRDFITHATEQIQDENKEAIASKQVELDRLETKLSAIDANLKRNAELYIEGSIEKDHFNSQKTLWSSQKPELTRDIERLKKEIAVLTPDPGAVDRLLRYAEWFNTLDEQTLEEKRQRVLDLRFTGLVTRKGDGEFIIDFLGLAPDNFNSLHITDNSRKLATGNMQAGFKLKACSLHTL